MYCSRKVEEYTISAMYWRPTPIYFICRILVPVLANVHSGKSFVAKHEISSACINLHKWAAPEESEPCEFPRSKVCTKYLRGLTTDLRVGWPMQNCPVFHFYGGGYQGPEVEVRQQSILSRVHKDPTWASGDSFQGIDDSSTTIARLCLHV